MGQTCPGPDYGGSLVLFGILLWLAYFTATYIVVKFLIRGALMHFAGSPAAQGLAAVTEA